MNKIYRVVWNTETGQWVVASEMAKSRKKAAGGRKAAIVTSVLASMTALSGAANATIVINGNPQETVIGCSYIYDENPATWHNTQGSAGTGQCIAPAGTSDSGQGDPGKRAIFYASDDTNTHEDSLNLGGYLDTWKTATFHGGADMAGTKLTGLADATGATDAVNFKQLQEATKYFHANSTLADSTATGSNSIAVGPLANASGTNAIAMGNNAAGTGSNAAAFGVNASAGSDNSQAIGDSAKTKNATNALAVGSNASVSVETGDANQGTAIGYQSNVSAGGGAMALGASAKASALSGVAIGSGATASTANSVALGAGSISDRANTISVGKSGAERQIVNVKAGTADTDAVNVSQLKGVTTALGGGSVVNADGTVKQPSYTIGGTTYNNVGDALTAAAASGGSGDALNWNATTGAYDATHGGGTSPNKIVNVANGTNANDAVNFSQLKASEQSVATALGGGSTVNTDGTITKPSYDVNGTKYDNVGGAVDALDTRIDGVAANPLKFSGNSGTDVSRKLGDALKISGLASTAGTFSGNNIKTVADATTGEIKIQMADAPKFGNITVNDSGKISGLADGTAASDAVTKGQMDTAVAGAGKWKLTANGATAKTITSSDTVNLVDGKNTKASFDSTTNQLKVDVVDAPTFSGMVTANGGLTVGAGKTVDMGGNKITKVAAGTADTDAVNFSQLKATSQSVADALGGGSTVDATTGKISEPTYSVDGKDAAGVDGAITALDDSIKSAKDGIDGLNADMADVVKYDAADHKKVTFGEAGTPVVLDNVGNGTVAKDSKQAINGGQLFDVQTALTDKGMVFGANSGTNVTRKLGETLTIKGGATPVTGTFSDKNVQTATDTTNGGIIIKMADSPQFGNIVINKGGNGTIDMGGGKVTNMGDATAAGDAVNKGQMDKAISDATGGFSASPLTFAGNSGSVTRKLGDTVTIKGGKKTAGTYSSDNITTEAAADGSLTIKLADAPKFGEITINDDGKITGLENGTAAGDAATAGQLQELADAIGGGATIDPETGKVTEPTFTITDKDGEEKDAHTVADAFDTMDQRVDTIDGRVTVVEGNVTNIMNGAGIKYFHTNSTLADSQAKGVDSVAIGGNAIANAKNSVALGSNSTADRENTVSVGKAGAERQIVNVKAGVEQTDAVNVSQLKGIADVIGGGTAIDPTTGAITPPTFDVTDKDGNTVPAATVADAISTIDDHVVNVDNRVTNIEGDVTNILDGKAGLVQQDETTREITVGKDTDGTVVNFTNKDGEARVLDGVANGSIAEGSQQAINGGQAHDIAQSVADSLGGGATVDPDTGEISMPQYDVTTADGTKEKVDGVEGAITNLDGRVYQNTSDISNLYTQINEGSVGLVQYDDATGTVTVAAAKGGTTVDFANVDGEARQLKNVAAGAEDTDAVNVKQLKDILGGTATQDENGNYVGPTYNITNIDGTTHTSTTVGDALYTIDGRVTNLYQQVNEGTVGLVQQAAGGEKLTVGKDTDGTEVNFAGTAGDRKLTGVANGEVSDKSHDAVNGSQLYTVAQSVADAMGGGSTVNEDGSVTMPVYNVTADDGTTTTVTGIEGAITNLDQRTYSNTTQIENITNQINNGGLGLVQQAEKGADLTVGKGTDGKAVNFTGTDGDRVLTGVAAGSADNDAVNIKQLKDAGVINKDGSSNAVVTYDNAEKTSITMGGEGASTPVAIHNVADGVADRDAVNVGQLNQRLQANNTEVLNQANSYTDQRINDVWQDLGDEINQVNRQANRGIAAASALVNVTPYLPGKTAVNAGVASYRGEAALGVGVSRWSDNGRVNFNAGVSAAKGDQPVFRVGVGYVF